jgi:hypothetical protein
MYYLFSDVYSKNPEPVVVHLLRSPGIDSQSGGGPVRQPYLTYWPARLHRLAEWIPGLLKRLTNLGSFLYLDPEKLQQALQICFFA